eukprot:541706-Pyramimonas_sp.AAC.1
MGAVGQLLGGLHDGGGPVLLVQLDGLRLHGRVIYALALRGVRGSIGHSSICRGVPLVLVGPHIL